MAQDIPGLFLGERISDVPKGRSNWLAQNAEIPKIGKSDGSAKAARIATEAVLDLLGSLHLRVYRTKAKPGHLKFIVFLLVQQDQ